MSKGTLQIHSENILPIIKKWLYSDKDIFVRELISNACDAIYKVKLLRDQGKAEAKDEEFRIDVAIDKEKKTLTFTDTGIGMDAKEVEEYIAQIAFSGAEAFVEKYKSNEEKEQFIGHFGLGFYSTYMVASKVEVDTLSYKKNAKPALWSCDGSPEYTMEKGTRTERGTTITLHIGEDGEEFLDETRLRTVMQRYCAFLPTPIFLGETKINTQEPLWVKAPSECSKQDYLEFYRHLYPMQEDPLFWVHLNVDYPFHLKGILYFPKLQKNYGANKSEIKLFCNRVFVSEECKEIIPQYLSLLRGVIESPDIPLNVSRSYLQMDRTVRQLGNHISKKVADSLSSLYNQSRDDYISYWEDIGPVVKWGALEDPKFYDKVKDLVLWKTVGDTWTNIAEYLERNKEKTKDKIFHTQEEHHQPHFLDIYKEKGIEVLISNHIIDSHLMQFLEQKLTPVKFQRIDASVEEHLIDKEKEKTVLDAEGKTEAARLSDFIRPILEEKNLEIEAKSLASESLPGFIVINEEQRRIRDYMQAMQPDMASSAADLMGKQTFIANTNSPLIQSIQKLHKSDPTLAKEMVLQVYQQALLSQRELEPKQLSELIARNNHILEELAKKASQ